MAGAPMPTGLRATPPAKGRAPPPANGGHVVHVASSRAPWHSEDAAPARRSAERDVQPRAFHGSTQLSAGPPLVGLNYASRALENVRAPRASEKVSTRAARYRTGSPMWRTRPQNGAGRCFSDIAYAHGKRTPRNSGTRREGDRSTETPRTGPSGWAWPRQQWSASIHPTHCCPALCCPQLGLVRIRPAQYEAPSAFGDVRLTPKRRR